MKSAILFSALFLAGCGTHISNAEKTNRSDKFIERKTPTGAELVEIINRSIPAASNTMTWPNTAFSGAEWIYKYRGRCYYKKVNSWRKGDDVTEVNCS